MPRPFPFALGIGIDICHVSRIYNLLTKPNRSAQKFLLKLLNPTEVRASESWLKAAVELDTLKADKIQYSEIPRTVVHAKIWPLARFMSGRWAAKEAAIKAHTLRRISMHDITIHRRVQEGRSKAPNMTIKAKNGGEEQVVKFNISHDGVYATAVCLVAEEVEELEAFLPSGDADGPAGGADSSSPTNHTALKAEQETTAS